MQLIAEGSSKLASVPSGGASASSGGAAAPAAAGGDAAAPAEEKKEEAKEESDDDMVSLHTLVCGGLRWMAADNQGFGLFD